MSTFALFDDGTSSEIVIGDFLDPLDGFPLKAIPVNMPDRTVIHSAQNGFWAAYHILKKLNLISESICFSYQFKENFEPPILGHSAGLGFCLKLVTEAYFRKTGRTVEFSIAATGVLSEGTGNAEVKQVNGISAKFSAAMSCLKRGDLFFYPSANQSEITGHMRGESLHRGIEIVPVATAHQAVMSVLDRAGVHPPAGEPWLSRRFVMAMVLGTLVLSAGTGLFLYKPSVSLTATSELIPSVGTPSTNRDLISISSGDGFRIQFAAKTDCYLYIFQMDSQKNLTLLFPSSGASRMPNPLLSGRTYQFPEGEDWFILDKNTGAEKVVVFASKRPASDLEEAYYRLSGIAPGQDKEKSLDDFMTDLDRRGRRCTAGTSGCSEASFCFYKEHAFWHK
jgi:hypothetical protein